LPSNRYISDPQIAKALTHPLRVSILGILEERTASPREISEELDAPLGVVSYHVRQLARSGLARLERTRQRRGALEHYYSAQERPIITSEAWANVPSIVKQATIRAALAKISGQVNRAAESGGFEDSSIHLTRTSITLDRKGWEQLSAKMDRLVEDFERIQAAAAKRLAASDHAEEINAIAVLMLFEAATASSSRAKQPDSHRRGRKRTARVS
jgi:DNA-binding transcriptional ArsR family regulator